MMVYAPPSENPEFDPVVGVFVVGLESELSGELSSAADGVYDTPPGG